MALYKNGNPVSGLNSIPRLTLAQYNALNVKPEFWVRTDAPESYKKLSADQVSYDSNDTVKDKIDDIEEEIASAIPQTAIKRTTATVTTFSDGAFAIPNINPTNQILLNIDGVGMLFMFRYTEQNQYVGVAYNNNLQPISSQSINIRFTYIDLSEY